MVNSSCVLCGTKTSLHQHHIIPQAYGGATQETVMLCATHHQLIHTLATKVLTSVRKGNHAEVCASLHWENQATAGTARYLVASIVTAALHSRTHQYKVTLEFTAMQRQLLEELKHKLNTSSIPKAIYLCLDQALARLHNE